MNIVIPMAGRGERFKEAGFKVPKPLIEIDGTPLFVLASLSLPLKLASRLIYVVLDDWPPNQDVSAIMRRYAPRAEIEVVRLKEVTRGQSETVLLGLKNADASSPLLIYNCDSYFKAAIDWAAITADPAINGALVCFESRAPRYSYARVGDSGLVDLVAEKVVISNHASTGAYYFGSCADFMGACNKRLQGKNVEAGEYYVAPLYNDLIAMGKRIKVLPCERFICFGTPGELSSVLESAVDRALLQASLHEI